MDNLLWLSSLAETGQFWDVIVVPLIKSEMERISQQIMYSGSANDLFHCQGALRELQYILDAPDHLKAIEDNKSTYGEMEIENGREPGAYERFRSSR